MILIMPSSVTEVLSLVWAAGNNDKVSKRLSFMSACDNLQRSSITSTISNMIRFSNPITTSKFLKPISRSEEHTSELQSRGHLVCRLLLEIKIKHWVDNIYRL